MRVKAVINLLGKVTKPWKDKDGNDRISYKVNYGQENNEIVDTLPVTFEQYNMLVVGKTYVVSADYGTGTNGGYLRVLDITENK